MLKILALLAALQGQTVGTFADGPISYKDTSIAVTTGGAAFAAQAINTTVTTDAIKTKGYRYLKLTLNYTWAAGTAVTMTCQNSEDATTWSDIHVLQYTTWPTAASSPQVWSYTTAASKVWDWTIAVRGVYMRCAFVATGAPTSSDKLTVTGRLGVF